MKRYFIYTFYHYRNNWGGSSGNGYQITDGSFPSKRQIMNKHEIPTNIMSVVSVSEVKSKQDIADFFSKELNEIEE